MLRLPHCHNARGIPTATQLSYHLHPLIAVPNRRPERLSICVRAQGRSWRIQQPHACKHYWAASAVVSAAQAGAGAESDVPEPLRVQQTGHNFPVKLRVKLRKAVNKQIRKLDGLWGRFLPMACLFFLMSFINTILDSLANSLVITAVGGGTEVIPFLTVYGVLPCSFLFLFVYSWATQRLSRATLFNIIIGAFLVLYGSFAVMYPSHESMHFHGAAEEALLTLPSGLAGLVGMLRNWMFTAFYCVSELWGDIVLSLLFWGLANDTTTIRDAPLLYPLFGVGANIAQTLAGRMLSLFSNTAGPHMTYETQLQACMTMVLVLGVAVLGLHHYITMHFPSNASEVAALQSKLSASKPAAARLGVQPALSGNGVHQAGAQAAWSVDLPTTGLGSLKRHGNGAPIASSGGNADDGLGPSTAPAEASSNSLDTSASPLQSGSTSSGSSSSDQERAASGAAASTSAAAPAGQRPVAGKAKRPKPSLTVRQAVVFLFKSPQIRCLAMMALAQGLSTNLLDVAWKTHLHMLHPSPGAYAAFMGNVAMWTGLVTGSLMFTSPFLFDRMGWRGIAGATPRFMLWAGMPFFAGTVVYALMPGQGLASMTTLRVLVLAGAVLQVFARGAKFSMFKPAEEMVYIGLDEESRTKGKAAIDVVGAQTGKSFSSILQQMLLLLSGGSRVGTLPVMSIAFFGMLKTWISAVNNLALHSNISMTHSTFETEDEQPEQPRLPPDGSTAPPQLQGAS